MHSDCNDGSDEASCKQAKCKDNEFTCDNKRCISKKWVCDKVIKILFHFFNFLTKSFFFLGK